jgi:peroxiredoxin
MDLQDKLDLITSRTRKLVQPERLAFSEQATADLFTSGIEEGVLPVGSPSPAFSLVDGATGKLVRSSDLLALGPVILNFFRGRWCPYCVTELEAWRDLYPAVREAGALFVAVSPQNKRQNSFTAEQHRLSFPVLSDPDATLATAFGIAYTVPPAARAYFRSILVNIPFANSGKSYDNAPEAAWRLPLPATFILRPDGSVAFGEAHADFRVRPEPSDVLRTLRSL